METSVTLIAATTLTGARTSDVFSRSRSREEAFDMKERGDDPDCDVVLDGCG